ncbi:MAG: transcriptional regulator, AraC family [Tardiphaga sp.]|jgi:AraC-like DNA-binding protein|nr:transcriptional regulator, AraC family [Tardiphaga sp.]
MREAVQVSFRRSVLSYCCAIPRWASNVGARSERGVNRTVLLRKTNVANNNAETARARHSFRIKPGYPLDDGVPAELTAPMIGDVHIPRLEKRDNALIDSGMPRGMIDPRGSAQRIQVWRFAPSPKLAAFFDHHWIIEWRLADRSPEEQRVVPSPNAHLLICPGETALFGVVRGIQGRLLQGNGRALGLRFRTGGLRPFLTGPVAQLTGRTVSTGIITGQTDARSEELVFGQNRHQDMIRAAEAIIEPRLPDPDPTVDVISSILAAARRQDGPRRAETLANDMGLNLRAMQRLFHDYVGVSPKWLLRRYRLQEAAWLLAQGGDVPLAALAADLGYFDQAHLARDFKCLFGCAPAQYRKTQSGPRSTTTGALTP